ncbi:MAG: FAD-dependent oxidoreductase [Myxococcota bacterium]
MAPKKVLVAGAGIAGLGAAWQLSRRGYDVILTERESRCGGRARSEVRDGFAIESSGGIISTADRALLSWIGELGLSDDLLPLRPVSSAMVYRDRSAAVDARDWRGIARIPGIKKRHAIRLARLPRLDARYGGRIDPDRPERAAGLDDRSLADFGGLYFGKTTVDRWMAPLVTRESLGDAQNASRVLFLLHYRRDPRARLGLLRSAFGEIAERAGTLLSARFGVEVTSVDALRSGCVRVEDTRGSAEVDAVVLATSAPVAARVSDAALTLAERDAFEKVRYLPALRLVVALRRPFSSHPQFIQFPADEDSPLESVTLEYGLKGGRAPEGHGLALLRAKGAWSRRYFSAPDKIVKKQLIEAMGRVLPRIHGAALFTQLLREPYAVPVFEVGRYREIADFHRIQADQRANGRRIYFAGDYLMGPGWDAALRAGMRTAAAVEQDLGAADSAPSR